ncbi:TetR/AcrR family transcriptional regulator [Nocardia iowensis]|uniref:WHG domain-containing protein n=1 Tax=Nocardia iowensis TaxID=204891 RepID=A0ABX8REP1_NOCIO|nr:TetR/AcrR family transcriptional regulator [Nocardia iowensis]QXN88075.1 WHG domain-containing protein [Nocardia iowensis]
MSFRSRSYHHGDLRATLLQRAEVTLRESGVDGLSLRQLARDAGVSHAAPSRHFRDKQALLDALALSGFERLAEVYQGAAVAGTFAERLHAIARAYLTFAIENPELLAVMFARKHSPDPGAEMAAAVAKAFAVPMAAIAEGQARGEVAAGDPMRIGMPAVAALQGLATFVGSGFVAAENLDELLADTIGQLMVGLRPRD